MQINNSKKKSKKKKVIIQLTLQVQVGTQTRKFNVLSNDHNIIIEPVINPNIDFSY